jgi:lysophospholipase L1-like esterase
MTYPVAMKRARTAGIVAIVGLVVACSGGGSTEPAQAVGPTEAAPPPSAPPPAPAAPSDPAPPAPAATPDVPTASKCFQDLTGPVKGPDYDALGPVVDKACAGTHHQTITGVQRVVFLGDSITTGTPPTAPNQFYRSVLAEKLKAKFGNIEVSDCSAWGARMDDLLAGKGELANCFKGGVQTKRTLVVMTMGGNDIASWAKNKLDTASATTEADTAAGYLRDAVHWLQDPTRFPNGSFVVFSNVYEYTDTSGDLASCPTASLSGMGGSWPDGAPAVVHFQEQIMKVAVDTKTDMVFLLEHFCGHGYRRGDPSLQCYRGPNAEGWFDLTCIHPTPEGHAQIAKLFGEVIDG